MTRTSYVAFLRGINVSGQKKVAMESLRNLCINLGFVEVKTYIQSGNIFFKSTQEDKVLIEKSLIEGILDQFGFSISVGVKTVKELIKIVELNPYTNSCDLDGNKVYFVLLNSVPSADLVRKLEDEIFTNEDFFINKNCVYLKCNNGYGKAKLNNNLIERKLKVSATTRNYKTMMKMLVLARVN